MSLHAMASAEVVRLPVRALPRLVEGAPLHRL